MSKPILAIDFGTSNTAVAVVTGADVRHVVLEGTSRTVPSAVFLPEGGAAPIWGQGAVDALIAGEDGRFMRALKSILGTPLLHEKRLIAGRRRTLADILTAFLAEMKGRAETQSGASVSRVLSGRPVRFHSRDAEADARAVGDLEACYRAAGFTEVSFLAEPEAAAFAAGEDLAGGDLSLIVDIGGGTSDFTLFRRTPEGPSILASHGIRLGGTDFDQSLSVAHAMPLLGLGSQLRREMGTGTLPVPVKPFHDLATWAAIPFLYTQDMRRSAAQMEALAVHPERLARLRGVLEMELGHDLAFAVERAKIAANTDGMARIEMGFIETSLGAVLEARALADTLGPSAGSLAEAMEAVCASAKVQPSDVATAVFVGGSSLLGTVRDVTADALPSARVVQAKAFTAVIDGLAVAART